MWLLTLEYNISIKKEVSNSGKNQIQGGQVNAFLKQCTQKMAYCFKLEKKELTSNKVYKVQVITIQCVNEA